MPDEQSACKNSKVVADGMGKYRCEKDGKLYDTYCPKYILRFCASDFSGNLWLTAFDACARSILRTSAREAEQMLLDAKLDEYESIFSSAACKQYVFRICAKTESYQEELRVKYTVLNVQLANFESETRQMFERINSIRGFKNKSNCF